MVANYLPTDRVQLRADVTNERLACYQPNDIVMKELTEFIWQA